jgi:hypothetical protein
MTRRPIVTDHAVLRYLERAHGLDVEFFRSHIATLTAAGVQHGATGVKVEGVNFVLQDETVVTVLEKGWHSRDLRSNREDVG